MHVVPSVNRQPAVEEVAAAETPSPPHAAATTQWVVTAPSPKGRPQTQRQLDVALSAAKHFRIADFVLAQHQKAPFCEHPTTREGDDTFHEVRCLSTK